MATNIDNLIIESSLSANTITATTMVIGGTSISTSNSAFSSLSATTFSGGTIYSGGTDLYNIFSQVDTNDITRVQPGSNITTGGTANFPTISLVASPSINNLTSSGSSQLGTTNASSLSGGTISGGTIYSGNTDVSSLFATPENITLINSQLATKANLSGATFTGTINTGILSATTLSASTSIFTSSIKYPVSPVLGYILTSDASGNATWQSPTVSSTAVDMQAISTATTATATGTLVDVPGMVLTTQNLGSSATTYNINFAGIFSNNNNNGNSSIRATLNGLQISNSPVMTFTNAGASLNAARRNISLVCEATGVTNGDVIKIQMSASTGTVTAQAGKTLSIIGFLNSNIV